MGDKLIITTSIESITSALDHLSLGNTGGVTTTTKLVIPELPETGVGMPTNTSTTIKK